MASIRELTKFDKTEFFQPRTLETVAPTLESRGYSPQVQDPMNQSVPIPGEPIMDLITYNGHGGASSQPYMTHYYSPVQFSPNPITAEHPEQQMYQNPNQFNPQQSNVLPGMYKRENIRGPNRVCDAAMRHTSQCSHCSASLPKPYHQRKGQEQKKKGKSDVRVEDLVEIATFVSAGIFLLYLMKK